MPASIDEKSLVDLPSPGSSSFDSTRSDFDIKESLLDDVEAQIPHGANSTKLAATSGAEYEVPTRTKLMYLGGYFMLNLSLTIYNKAMLGSVCLTPSLSSHSPCVHTML